MSRWTHSFCAACWAELNPGREAVRVKDVAVETCCRCGRQSGAGIYVRHDPQTLPCGGRHPDDAE